MQSADPGTVNSTQPAEAISKQPRRHRLFGWMKSTVTIMPETDLTEPADPNWADIAWGEDRKVVKTRRPDADPSIG